MMLWISGCESFSSRGPSSWPPCLDSGSLSPGTLGSSLSELGAALGSPPGCDVGAAGVAVEFM